MELILKPTPGGTSNRRLRCATIPGAPDLDFEIWENDLRLSGNNDSSSRPLLAPTPHQTARILPGLLQRNPFRLFPRQRMIFVFNDKKRPLSHRLNPDSQTKIRCRGIQRQLVSQTSLEWPDQLFPVGRLPVVFDGVVILFE